MSSIGKQWSAQATSGVQMVRVQVGKKMTFHRLYQKLAIFERDDGFAIATILARNFFPIWVSADFFFFFNFFLNKRLKTYRCVLYWKIFSWPERWRKKTNNHFEWREKLKYSHKHEMECIRLWWYFFWIFEANAFHAILRINKWFFVRCGLKSNGLLVFGLNI